MRRLVFILLFALVFTIPWENVIVFPMFGTLSRSIGLAAAALGVAAVLATGSLRPLRAMHLAMGLFVLWAGVSLTWSLDTSRSSMRLMTYVQLAGMAWLIWEFAPTRPRQLLLMYAYVFGGSVAIGTQMLSLFESGAASRLGIARFGGGGLDLNDFALIISMSIPIAVYCAMRTDRANRFLRLACWAYCPLAGLSVLMTGSRMGLIVLLVAGLLVVVSQLALRPAYALVPLAMAGVLAVKAPDWLPEKTLSRLTSTGKELRSGTWTLRRTIWEGGLKAVNRSPVVGTGAGTFPVAAEEDFKRTIAAGSDAHNSYLRVMVELGTIGMVLFIAMGVTAAAYTLGLRGQERFLWLVLLAAWSLGAFALGLEDRKLIWFLLGLLTTQYAAFQGEQAAVHFRRIAAAARRRRLRAVGRVPQLSVARATAPHLECVGPSRGSSPPAC